MKQFLLITFIFLPLISYGKTAKDTLKPQEIHTVTIIGNKSKSIPGACEIISTQKIEQLNQSNINNVLRIAPGVNVRDEEGFGLRPNIGLRGTAVNRSAKITLMEDGILIAPAPYSDPSAYYFPTFARMQGVEILKGSSQIKHGPYTISGAINLLSTAIPNSFKGLAQISYGSFNTNQQRIWLGDSRKNIDYVFEVNRIASNGFKQLDNNDKTGFDRRDIMGKVRWHTEAKNKIYQAATLKFVSCAEDGNETYLGLTYSDYLKNPLRRYAGTQKDKLNMNHQHISLTHTITPINGLNISTTAYYANTFRDWARASKFGGESINNILNKPTTLDTAYAIMTGKTNGNIDFQSAARTYQSTGVQLNAVYKFKTKYLQHSIQLGTRLHTDASNRYATDSKFIMQEGLMIPASVGINGNKENQIRSASSLASYLAYDVQFKGLKISPGLRYEKIKLNIDNYGTSDPIRIGSDLKKAKNEIAVILPGIGINYDLNKDMNIFGGVHKGFSPPGMPSTNTGEVQALPESSVNYELGYRIYKAAWHAQAVAFANNFDNILGSDNISGGGAGTGDVFNAGNAIVKGIELNTTYNLLANRKTRSTKLPLTIAYTYTSARFAESFINGGGDWGTGAIATGDFIPFVTPHLLTISVGVETKKLDATLVGRYTGSTRIKPGQDALVFPSITTGLNDINSIAGFLIIDLSGNYHLNNRFTIFTLLNNLTNSKAIISNLPQGYRPNMPLSFNMGIKAKL